VLAAGVVVAVLSLLALAYCVLELATSRPSEVRGLPKPLWFLVLLLPVVGPVSWFLFGRPAGGASTRSTRRAASSPDDDEDFLRQLRRGTEEQRRRAEQQRRRADGEDRPA
jgi:hypothetical protein